jgi:hypothetical protein
VFVRTDPACGSVLKWLDRSTPIAARQLVPKRTGWRAFFVVGSVFASWHPPPKQHQSRTRASVPTGTLFWEPPERVTSAGERGEVANDADRREREPGHPPTGPINSGPNRANEERPQQGWRQRKAGQMASPQLLAKPARIRRRSRGSITRKNDDDLPRKSNLPARSLQIDTI